MTSAILANVFGRLWSAVLAILFVPIYLRLLGPEGYGLVGLNTLLVSIFLAFDGGVRITLNREIARLSHLASNLLQMEQMLSTATALMTMLACSVGAAMWFSAPWIADQWLDTKGLDPQIVLISLRLIGLVCAEQIFIALYQGTLFGLHRQVVTNVVLIIASTVRAGGVALILEYVSATPVAFFAWYAIISGLQVAASRLLIAQNIPIRLSSLWPGGDAIRNFVLRSAGFGAVALLSLALSQIDKILVSRTLPLAEFGYYMVAVTIAQVPTLISSPVAAAIFPNLSRFSALDPPRAIELFHRGTQIIAIPVAALGVGLIFFSHEIIFAWTGSEITTQHVAKIAAVLTLANAVNSILQMSYYLEMAHGRTRLINYVNILAVIILIPSIIVLARQFGAIGAASCWLALNLCYLFITTPLINWRSLGTGVFRLYTHDLLPPIATSLVIAGVARMLTPWNLDRIDGGAVAACVLVLSTACGALSSPGIRHQLRRRAGALLNVLPRKSAS